MILKAHGQVMKYLTMKNKIANDKRKEAVKEKFIRLGTWHTKNEEEVMLLTL